ncbi:MAG: branched-chain amino acid ABC transporter permease [Candidatus Velthaea sp.]
MNTRVLPIFAGLALVTLPFWIQGSYLLHMVQLIGAYWILIAGLNLVAGYSGQLSIGHVGLLAIGSYTYAILAGKHGFDPLLAMLCAGAICALCGLLLGLPALRLPGFYFAMATIAFALIVSELSLAQGALTGGGAGLPVPDFNKPFTSPAAHYWLILAIGTAITVMSWNVTRFMWGRALIAVRDSEVAARACGVSVYRTKLTVFIFSGFTAGVGGALFASLQTYITPETFRFELGLFFFTCIIVGGRGSILGPFIGTVVLTALPDLAAPLAKLGTFFYGLVLLLVVLLVPEGFGRFFEQLFARFRPASAPSGAVEPDLKRLAHAIGSAP